MGDKSLIEWTDATWNPVSGCSKVSQGCKHCYAERVFPRPYPGRAFTDVRCHPERLDQPLHWKKPRRIFVNSMSDLFHEDVPFEFIDNVFAVMALASQHTFQVLTKRPGRMLQYVSRFNNTSNRQNVFDAAMAFSGLAWTQVIDLVRFPLHNVWLGVSVEDQATADERIPLLLQIPAAVRWISAEPLLGNIDFYMTSDSMPCLKHPWRNGPILGGIDWVVVGGESGPQARPMHPDWARSLRDQCVAAGVPFFFKQWGEWLPRDGIIDDGMPDQPMIRLTIIGNNGHNLANSGDGGDVCMQHVGKKSAGRLLDGQLWDEYPI